MRHQEQIHGNPSLIELIRAVQLQMKIDFEVKSAQIPHPGGRGTAREDALKGFLGDYLPERFGVGEGYIIDAAGGVSKQMDVVIYDRLAAPVFKVSQTQRLFPVECVAGVVSVKSHLDVRELNDAVVNLESVAKLDRLAGGRPTALYGGVPSEFSHSTEYIEPVFTTLFAYDSISLESLALALGGLNQGKDAFLRTQLIGVLNRGVITYGLQGVLLPSYSPEAAVTFVSQPDLALPLFYSYLADGVIRKIPVQVSFMSYLQIGWITGQSVR